ncbi:HU family DNA-binding protein [Oceanospirillum sanctuarii]|uniref:HU family DNA-binding protein n=1 Tax=Oceanospirillum sanctuarii TaxID=1434821 RepID=UPI000A3ABB91|nr:HU family DNA-binding protein [Oceanospirillum sanctuarii]
MRKPELAAAIAEKAELSKDKANEVLNALLDEITGAVAKGDSVSLIGFGTFSVRERSARKGKNPQTGEPMDIPASKTVGFKVGKKLKDAVDC